MWPFRSRTQKRLDALQDLVNARRRAVSAALEIFRQAYAEFERSEPSLNDEDQKAFIVAHGRYGYFMNVLLSDISWAEDSIHELRTAAKFAGGGGQVHLAAKFVELDSRLARTEQTCRSLGKACAEMAEIAKPSGSRRL